MEKLMGKESIVGLTAKSMTVNGEMESKKDMECGRVYLETRILGSGKILKLMGMVSINGKMVIDMKVKGGSA
jgi:hypothetical protein